MSAGNPSAVLVEVTHHVAEVGAAGLLCVFNMGAFFDDSYLLCRSEEGPEQLELGRDRKALLRLFLRGNPWVDHALPQPHRASETV